MAAGHEATSLGHECMLPGYVHISDDEKKELLKRRNNELQQKSTRLQELQKEINEAQGLCSFCTLVPRLFLSKSARKLLNLCLLLLNPCLVLLNPCLLLLHLCLMLLHLCLKLLNPCLLLLHLCLKLLNPCFQLRLD